MKLTYLGTAAAEGWPALFCDCPSCRSSAKLGGKSIRSRSQALINDDLLIDFPADSYWHIISNNIDLDLIKNIIITHSHEDHLYIDDFANRTQGYIPKEYAPPFVLNLYGNDGVHRLYDKCMNNGNATLPQVVAMHEIYPFEAVQVGNYTVYPMPADHFPAERSYIYLIVENATKKTLLYAHDTGYLKDECWEFLKDFKVDIVSLDCTSGKIKNCRRNHMGFDVAAEVKQRLITEGISIPETIFVINHFSHNGLFLNHEDIEDSANEFGFLVSYDGRTIEV